MSLRGVTKIYSRTGARTDTIKETILVSLARRSRPDLVTAMDNVDLEIARGEAIGIIGANGSGKSTLLKIIAGITEPTAGAVAVCGRVISMIELGTGIHPNLSGEENIRLQGSMYGLAAAQIEMRIEPILEFAELRDFRHLPVKHYSSGMFVRLGFAIAVHTEPEVLLVDEVLAVGDLRFQERCLRRIRQLVEGGMTLVLVTHYPEQAERLCGRVIWLEEGRVRGIGPAPAMLVEYHGDLIARYHAVSKGLPDEGTVAIGIPGRFGSGEARMSGVRLLDGCGRPCSNLRRGQSMAIEIDYTAQPGIESVDCIVVLEDTTFGTPLTMWRALRDARPGRPRAGKGAFRIAINKLPLLPGRYCLTFTIHPVGDINEPYDMLYKLYHFTIEAEPDWDTVAPLEITPSVVVE